MSAPAVNAFVPEPRSTIQRMFGSASNCPSAAGIPRHIASLSALRFAGLSKISQPAVPRFSTSNRPSLIAFRFRPGSPPYNLAGVASKERNRPSTLPTCVMTRNSGIQVSVSNHDQKTDATFVASARADVIRGRRQPPRPLSSFRVARSHPTVVFNA